MKNTNNFFNYWAGDRGLLFLLISISVLIFLIYPLVGNSVLSSLIANVFLLIVLFSGLITLDIKPVHKKILIGFLVFIVILGRIEEAYENNFITQLHIFSRIVFLWMLIILIFIKVFGNHPVSFFYRIAGSLTIYLLIGFIWANMYFVFYQYNPDSFHFNVPLDPEVNPMFNFIYFSFESLTTLGLGDIIPVQPMLKSLVILEALLGPLYLAVLIGRLVSKRSTLKE